YNAPGQTVLAGGQEELERAGELAKERGGKAIPLAVAGAFHTPRMASAQEKLARSIEAVRFSSPGCTFVSGVTGRAESNPREISALLRRQMTSPVRWTAVVGLLGELGVREAVEVGPGRVLTRLGRMQTDAVGFRALGEVSDHG
ncbi:MAG: ACP S-malonyltransferase, partial [Candidatus Bipolaricaulota bacterium]